MIHTILKSLRKVYGFFFELPVLKHRNWKMFSNKQYSNELIYNMLMAEEPCMIARLGSTELLCITNFLGVKSGNKNWGDFVKGGTFPWWWEKSTVNQISDWSGFFPKKIELIEQFCELMLQDAQDVDLLGAWLENESYLDSQLAKSKKVVLEDLEPFFAPNPWTRALEGKKVLVIHPFAETISYQYERRELLFENGLLPSFELSTIKAVQSVAGEDTSFKDWFEALEWMKNEIDKRDFDIAIIGCGAYGFPLAAHIKRSGKKAIHLAGVTQMLFGIKGKRWEEYIVWPYKNLFNEHWVRPGEHEKPKNAVLVEGACYW